MLAQYLVETAQTFVGATQSVATAVREIAPQVDHAAVAEHVSSAIGSVATVDPSPSPSLAPGATPENSDSVGLISLALVTIGAAFLAIAASGGSRRY